MYKCIHACINAYNYFHSVVNRDVQRVDSVCNDIISKDKLKFQLLKTSHKCTKKGKVLQIGTH